MWSWSHTTRFVLPALLCAVLTIHLSACDSQDNQDSTGLGERVIPLGQPVPKGGGRYQVGVPYEIAGVRYTPTVDPDYDRTGIASWYGELFHGRYTANGEIYDMDRLSAAHPTLPLPVYVHVTNLKNGRSLIVRVNDRGPFRNGRILDLSRRSAEVLGFRRAGTAPVRVRYLRRAPLDGDDSYELAYLAGRAHRGVASDAANPKTPKERQGVVRGSAPGLPPRPDRPDRTPKTVAAIAMPDKAAVAQSGPVPVPSAVTPVSATAPQKRHVSEGPEPMPDLNPVTGPSIQAGSFRSKENADRARETLLGIAPVHVNTVDVAGETYYRVLVGPFPDDIEAAAAVPLVADAGYQGAKIVLSN